MTRSTYPEAEKRDAEEGELALSNGDGDGESIVIIPTYNEVLNLESLVSTILQVGPFHVLIVDDHSPDGTGELAEKLAQRWPGRVQVLHRPEKQGLGPAYIAGFRSALAMRYQFVFTMDADLSHDARLLPVFRDTLAESDVVLGSRYVAGGDTLNWPVWRHLISRCGSVYARLILQLPTHDLTGGFKGFRRQVLEALLPDLETIRAHGYAFQIEMTYRCARHGFQIVEVPILFENRHAGKSKMHAGIVAEALWVVWALRLNPGSEARIPHGAPRPAPQRMVEQGKAESSSLRIRRGNGLPPGRSNRRRRLLVALAPLALLLVVLGTLTLGPQLARFGPANVFNQRPNVPAEPQAPARPVGEPTPAASIEIRDPNLTPNAPIAFVGSKFKPGEPLTAAIENARGKQERRLEPLQADHDGQVNAVVPTFLLTLPPGTHQLMVKGMQSQRTALATFHIHWIQPIVQLATYYAKPRQPVTFSGNGFMPNETVAVQAFGPPPSTAHAALATVHANAEGNVMGRVVIPAFPEGSYTLSFAGDQSQSPVAVSFQIQGFHPWVGLDNYAPTPNTKLGLYGHDFAPGEEVLVYLNQRQGDPLLHLHADTSGSLAAPASWSVQDLSGQQMLIFVGQVSGAEATVPFTVQPPPAGK